MADSSWHEGLTDNTKANIHIILNQLIIKQKNLDSGINTVVFKNGEIYKRG